MKNLETVVRERNKAYYLLETGQDGERPGVMIRNAIGKYAESELPCTFVENI